jgi:hypothetical protein
MRRQVFLDVIGDRTRTSTFVRPAELHQSHAVLAANVTKRSDMQAGRRWKFSKPTRISRSCRWPRHHVKGYVANIRTMMRHRIQDLNYRDPFAGAQISLPKCLQGRRSPAKASASR